MWHSCPTTRNEAVDMSGRGNVAGFLYLQLNVYIHIVPPLGAYKSQLGGTHILLLLFYMVNVYFFFSAMVSCRYWHMSETVGMRKRSVFKIGGCVHSLIVLGFVGRCFHTFLSLKHFPTRIYWSIASIAAWGHLLFFYLHRTLLRN